MAQVRITDSDGVVKATIPLISLEKPESLDTLGRAQIGVKRDDLDSVSVVSGEDRVFVEDPAGVDTFGGILRTPGRGGSTPIIVGDSFGRYMDYAEGTPLGQEKVGVFDDTLIQECIDATPELSAGTLNRELSSGRTFVFSGVSQLAKARKVAETAGAEVVFQSDLTVDYGAKQHGADKTGTTLSPANGSFAEGTFQLDFDGLTGNRTHLSVYGVGQGSGQLEATIVPSDDTASYPNKATYTNNDWSAGDDKRWGRRTNKDIKRVDPLQDWGKALIEDLQNTETRVETVVKGTTVDLGDEFTIENPAEGLSATTLRAVDVTKIIDPNAGTKYKCTFSNHSLGRQNFVSEKEKLQGRYEQAFEGDLTRISHTPGRGPVDSVRDYVFDVKYPDDVVQEIGAELYIKGLNYRAYSAGAISTTPTSASNTAPNVLEAPNTDGGEVSLTADTENTIHTTNPNSDTQWIGAGTTIRNKKGSSVGFNISVDAGGNEYPASGNAGYFKNVADDGLFTLFIPVPGNYKGKDVDILVEPIAESATIQHASFFIAQGTHTHDVAHSHDPDPGLFDFDGNDKSPAHYPNNISVDIDGVDASKSISFDTGTDDGTQEFEATLDMSDELSSGWNRIAISSDGLGHLDATFVADLVRQKL